MDTTLQIRSVSELHQLLEIGKPLHPLVSVIKHTKDMNLNFEAGLKVNNKLYFISLKENLQYNFKYGRKSYDFQEGTLVFMRPQQIITSSGEAEPDLGGWSVFFHPDLIRGYALSENIQQYSFFDYGVNEGLHVSEKEKLTLYQIIKKIESELDQNIDTHSQGIIVHNIETLLKYSLRYYERQFNTRKDLDKDFIAKFEKYLLSYFESDLPLKKGIPSVKDCGESVCMSGKYLSDLLKKSTGKSITEHIHLHIVEKAKNKLLNTNDSINEIAYDLGFKYPQHFSKIFKSKTEISPKEYRILN
jgi:AraC-like DNA-binding protein